MEQAKPPSVEIITVKQVRAALNSADDVTIIGCFSSKDEDALSTYQDAGNNNIFIFLIFFTFIFKQGTDSAPSSNSVIPLTMTSSPTLVLPREIYFFFILKDFSQNLRRSASR